jgi:hypothetical protein
MDLDGDGAEPVSMLATVVSAEVEVSATGHDGTDKGAGATPVAPVCR